MGAVVVEPLFTEQVGGFFVFFAVFVDESVFIALHHADALRYTALEV